MAWRRQPKRRYGGELACADWLAVRDRTTQANLARLGIEARLAPDPAVRVAELFAAQIALAAGRGEPARLRGGLPQGYLAVQFSADFGDDPSLRRLASQLERVAAATGLAIVLFRAGTAPWHDDAEPYRRLAGMLPSATVRLFESGHLWDLCALLAGAAAYCGSSLHGRIVAAAFAVPAVNLVADPVAAKQVAYANTWDTPDTPACAEANGLAEAILAALAEPATTRRKRADQWVRAARGAAAAWLSRLPANAPTPASGQPP